MALIAILFASLAVVVTAQFPPNGGQNGVGQGGFGQGGFGQGGFGPGGFGPNGLGGQPPPECKCTSTYTTCVRNAMQSMPAMNTSDSDCMNTCLQGKLSAQGNQVHQCMAAPKQTIRACISAADASGRTTGRFGCTDNPSTNTQPPQPPQIMFAAMQALPQSDRDAMQQCKLSCPMPGGGPPRGPPPQGGGGSATNFGTTNGGGVQGMQGGRPQGPPGGMGGPHAALRGCAMAETDPEQQRCRPSKPCESEMRAADAQVCTCIKQAIPSLANSPC
jgi:hypothetical protein